MGIITSSNRAAGDVNLIRQQTIQVDGSTRSTPRPGVTASSWSVRRYGPGSGLPVLDTGNDPTVYQYGMLGYDYDDNLVVCCGGVPQDGHNGPVNMSFYTIVPPDHNDGVVGTPQAFATGLNPNNFNETTYDESYSVGYDNVHKRVVYMDGNNIYSVGLAGDVITVGTLSASAAYPAQPMYVGDGIVVIMGWKAGYTAGQSSSFGYINVYSSMGGLLYTWEASSLAAGQLSFTFAYVFPGKLGCYSVLNYLNDAGGIDYYPVWIDASGITTSPTLNQWHPLIWAPTSGIYKNMPATNLRWSDNISMVIPSPLSTGTVITHDVNLSDQDYMCANGGTAFSENYAIGGYGLIYFKPVYRPDISTYDESEFLGVEGGPGVVFGDKYVDLLYPCSFNGAYDQLAAFWAVHVEADNTLVGVPEFLSAQPQVDPQYQYTNGWSDAYGEEYQIYPGYSFTYEDYPPNEISYPGGVWLNGTYASELSATEATLISVDANGNISRSTQQIASTTIMQGGVILIQTLAEWYAYAEQTFGYPNQQSVIDAFVPSVYPTQQALEDNITGQLPMAVATSESLEVTTQTWARWSMTKWAAIITKGAATTPYGFAAGSLDGSTPWDIYTGDLSNAYADQDDTYARIFGLTDTTFVTIGRCITGSQVQGVSLWQTTGTGTLNLQHYYQFNATGPISVNVKGSDLIIVKSVGAGS